MRPGAAVEAAVVVAVRVVMASSGGGSWWLGDRVTFQVTTAPTACMDSFGIDRSSFTEGSMRAYLVVGAVVGVTLAAQAGALRGDPGEGTGSEGIARLIKQLGDDAFTEREAAAKQLEAIGAPAL